MARFARFDPAAPAPAQVLGWYDTGLFNYASLPDPDAMIEMTDAQWDHRLEFPHGVAGGALVAMPPPAAADAAQTLVPKALVVERIAAAGRLREVRAALKLGVPDDGLDDAALLLRERWEAARMVEGGDADVRRALTMAGLDADAILAAP